MPETSLDSSKTPAELRDRPALLILDMVNCFDFEGADDLQPSAFAAARNIHRLRAEFRDRQWPVIYVNDNFGDWHSEATSLVARALENQNPVTEMLTPGRTDYFVIKPQFSGFYATNLPVLLPQLGVSKLILTGIATDICVLFTAADAHMREYDLWVPADAVAAEDEDRGRWALQIMVQSMGAQTSATSELTVDGWLASLKC
ncbi:cysteine hydrolase family protein [Novosphingobium kaempferiae]|uniref:cysteine hydrolase family protein n=1 Tax=Novosphingobium kaempferiae TaxID=2896849 RepID=UPI001E428CFD|nr:isochorismatase family cysteine hydrolase [Novosphingobium kaempferiae]